MLSLQTCTMDPSSVINLATVSCRVFSILCPGQSVRSNRFLYRSCSSKYGSTHSTEEHAVWRNKIPHLSPSDVQAGLRQHLHTAKQRTGAVDLAVLDRLSSLLTKDWNEVVLSPKIRMQNALDVPPRAHTKRRNQPVVIIVLNKSSWLPVACLDVSGETLVAIATCKGAGEGGKVSYGN